MREIFRISEDIRVGGKEYIELKICLMIPFLHDLRRNVEMGYNKLKVNTLCLL